MKLKAVSGIVLTLLLVGTLTFALNLPQVKAEDNLVLEMNVNKTVVTIGEEINITLTLKNVGNSNVTITLPNTQLFDASCSEFAELPFGPFAWWWSTDKAFLQMIMTFTLGPGENVSETLKWDLYWYDYKNGMRHPPRPGTYYLFGIFPSIFEPEIWTLPPIEVTLIGAPGAAADVAMLNITPTKTIVGQGYSVRINVTVQDQGDYAETFDVIVYYDNLSIPTTVQRETFWSRGDVNRDGYIDRADLERVSWCVFHGIYELNCDFNKDGYVSSIDLGIVSVHLYGDIWTTFDLPPPIGARRFVRVDLFPGNQITLNVLWNTTYFAKGNYTISAYAWPVPSETDTADNAIADGWVFVSIAGDMNGDRYVGGLDIGIIGISLFTSPGDPLWNPNTDLTDDGYVGGIDVGIAGLHLFQSLP